jgi:hypothetical protein
MSIPKKDHGEPRPVLELNPDLAALGGMAASVDAETAYTDIPGEAPGAQVEEGTNYALEAQKMVDTMGALACGFCPEAAPLWAPPVRTDMAGTMAPVLEKYSFTMGAMPVEIVAIITCGPVLWQTARLIGDKIRRDRAAASDPQAPKAATAHQGNQRTAEPEAPRSPEMALYEAQQNTPQFPDM